MTLAPSHKEVSQNTTLDQFAVDVLALVYEYDHYFPGLMDHPAITEMLEQRLPSRIAAARAALSKKTAYLPLEGFCNTQLRNLRMELLDVIDIEDAAVLICDMVDVFYYWLRQQDAIAAEQVCVAVLLRQDGKIALHHAQEGAHRGHWSTFVQVNEFGESLQQAALRHLREVGVVTNEISESVAQSYDYFADTDELLLTVFMFVECPQTAPELKWFSEEDLPSPLCAPLANAVVDGLDFQQRFVANFV
jgi:ADP-ribose pyrophosphatase YjhB (NUDIX family)